MPPFRKIETDGSVTRSCTHVPVMPREHDSTRSACHGMCSGGCAMMTHAGIAMYTPSSVRRHAAFCECCTVPTRPTDTLDEIDPIGVR